MARLSGEENTRQRARQIQRFYEKHLKEGPVPHADKITAGDLYLACLLEPDWTIRETLDEEDYPENWVQSLQSINATLQSFRRTAKGLVVRAVVDSSREDLKDKDTEEDDESHCEQDQDAQEFEQFPPLATCEEQLILTRAETNHYRPTISIHVPESMVPGDDSVAIEDSMARHPRKRSSTPYPPMPNATVDTCTTIQEIPQAFESVQCGLQARNPASDLSAYTAKGKGPYPGGRGASLADPIHGDCDAATVSSVGSPSSVAHGKNVTVGNDVYDGDGYTEATQSSLAMHAWNLVNENKEQTTSHFHKWLDQAQSLSQDHPIGTPVREKPWDLNCKLERSTAGCDGNWEEAPPHGANSSNRADEIIPRTLFSDDKMYDASYHERLSGTRRPRSLTKKLEGQEQSKQAMMKDAALKAQTKHKRENRGDDMGKQMWRPEENGGSNDILTEENLRIFKALKIQARERRRRG